MQIKPSQTLVAIFMIVSLPMSANGQTLDIDTDTTLSSGNYSTINVDPGVAQTPAITANIGGTVRTTNLNVSNTATLNLSASARVISTLTVGDSATVNISTGARVNSLIARNTSAVSVTGGDFDLGIEAYDNSRLTIAGAAISSGGITVRNNSEVAIISGDNRIYSWDNAVMNVLGGNIRVHNSYLNSVTNLRGGTFTVSKFLGVFHDSVVNVYGTNLSMSFAGTGSSTNGDYRIFALAGTLEDGTSLAGVSLYDYSDGGYEVGNAANPNGAASPINFNPGVIAVPEPTALVHLTVGAIAGLGLLRTRSRRKAS